MRERKSNMLGDIVRMEAVNAGQNIGAGYVDQDDFYPADGVDNDDLDTIDMVYDNRENDLSSGADFFDGDYQNSYADGDMEDDDYEDFDDEDYDDFDDDEDYDYAEEDYDPDDDEYYDEEDDFESLNGYGNPYDSEAEWGEFDGGDDLDMEESTGNYNDLGSGGFDFFEGGDPELDIDYNKFDSDTYSEARGRRKKRGNAGATAEKVLSYTPIGMAKKAVDTRFSEEGVSRAEKRRDAREKRREERRADRQANRDNKKEERKDRKEERQGIRSQKKLAKIGEVEARSEATKALAVPTADVSSTQVTTDLNKKATEDKKGLSTGAIVGISLGALAVVGTALFFILRKK